MKFVPSIQPVIVLVSLALCLSEKENLKSKPQNALRGEKNDHSQSLAYEDLIRDLRRKTDKRTRSLRSDSRKNAFTSRRRDGKGSRPLNQESKYNQLRNKEKPNIKNDPDIVLYSKPVENLTIINGMVTEENRYNYMVTLTDQSGNHVCGGSLITGNLVLTAAHCRLGSISKAQIGRYNTENVSEQYEMFDIIGVVEHPQYNSKYFWNDFMILVLSGKSTYPTVSLINKGKNIPEDLTVLGWGVTDPLGSPYRGPLLEASVKYIPNSQCMTSAGFVDGIYGSYYGLIKDNNMCAGSDNSDSCFGDSGGPLIARGATGEGDIQVGVVSWGYGCNHPNFPGVYARIENQINWIQATVCVLSDDDSPSNFVCKKRTTRPIQPDSCNPKRGCDEGFTCINEKCIKDKDRNDRNGDN